VQTDDDDLRQILSINIRAARKDRHLTQTQLAIYADLSLSYMTDIERCKAWVSDKTLLKIAKALEISPWQLLRPAAEGKPEQQGAAGKGARQDEALWRASRDIKRQILTHLNATITEALTEYHSREE
jgi:transcriptional regulator with XRE-family HTH domain